MRIAREALSSRNHLSSMKKSAFKLLARINKIILPRYSKTDITRLSTLAKAIVAYRYWVLIQALD